MPLNTWIPTTALATGAEWVDSHGDFKPSSDQNGSGAPEPSGCWSLSAQHCPFLSGPQSGNHDQKKKALRVTACLMSTQTCHLLNSGQAGKTAPKWAKKYFFKKKTIPRSRHNYMMLYACMMWPFQNLSFYVPISATITGICLRWPNNIEKLSQKIPKIVNFPLGK